MSSIRVNVEEPISQSLTRQGSSIYSLKLHEVQTHLGSSEKPLGSMNLDELLKTVFSAEGVVTKEGLTRQGSLTLRRDLSKKTVDEVWRDIQQDKNGNTSTGTTHKQPTLGEITLEDLLFKAGVVTTTIVPPSNEQWVQYHQPQPQAQGFMTYPVYETQEVVYPTALMMGGLSDTQQQQHAFGRKRLASSGGEFVEKTVERRQKRMIKNRESAARSRARRQAYTQELEIMVSRLEAENEKLRRSMEVKKILPSEPPPDPKWKLRRTTSASF